MKVVIAHSPDSDDAFMHFAIGEGKIDTGIYEFDHMMADIETLNQHAVEGRHEVTAISIHAYAHLSDKYALLNHGASMGENYGPVLIAREPKTREDLAGVKIAVPGKWTSAALATTATAAGQRRAGWLATWSRPGLVLQAPQQSAMPKGTL